MKSYHVMIKGKHIGLFMFIKHSRIRFEGKITKDFLYLRAFKSSFVWGFHKRNVREIIHNA